MVKITIEEGYVDYWYNLLQLLQTLILNIRMSLNTYGKSTEMTEYRQV